MDVVDKSKSERWIGLTKNRRLVLDVCALSRGVPLFPAERQIDLAAVAAARSGAPQRISWAALFTKAFALAAAEQPQLRQAYLGFPWPHVYEHECSVASIATHRFDGGEDRLCWAKINRVDELALTNIQATLDLFKTQPIEEVFRKQHRMSRLPRPLRRLLWILALRLSGRSRAKTLGTFSMSSLAGLGAYNRFHPTVLTSSISYGPIEADGSCLVTLICDHRVLDGYRAAICLQELEAALTGPIVAELQSIPAVAESARAA